MEIKWHKGLQKFTVFGSVEFHKELLHAIVDRLHLVITHHPDDLIHVNPTHPKWKKTTIYAKEHFLKSKIQKKNSEKITDSFIKSMSRRLLGEDIVSLSVFAFCSLCVAASHTTSGNNSNIYRKVWNACFTVHKCTNPNRLTTQTNNSYLSVKRKIWWPRCTIVQ